MSEPRISDERLREIVRESYGEEFGGRLFGQTAGPTVEEIAELCMNTRDARDENARLRAALLWIKTDLLYRPPEDVARFVNERIVERIDDALEGGRGDTIT